MTDGRLSIAIDHPNGTTTRWGEDELDAGAIPADLTFGTSMPGGFKDLSCSLLRDLDRDGNETLFDTVRVLGNGGRTTAWEGRIQQMPRSTDSGGKVTPAAVGWSAHLEDDKTFRFIYQDCDLSRWTGATLERKIAVTQIPYKHADGSVGYSVGKGPTLEVNTPAYAWSSNAGRPNIVLMYDAGPGLTAKTMIARFSKQGLAVDNTWVDYLFATDDSVATSGGVLSPQFSGYSEGDVISLDLTDRPRRYFFGNSSYAGAPAGGADSGPYGMRLYDVTIRGPHGLTPATQPAGKWPDGTDAQGYLASDILGHALPLAAPLLRFTTGTTGSIRPTDFPIWQCTFLDPSSAADVVGKLNAYHLWNWAVWENRTFYFAPPGTNARTWVLSTADGLDLSLEGDSADVVINGVLVSYTDAGGVTHTVGPPGATAEATDGRLVSTDPSNPATSHGIQRRWAVLTLSTPATTEGATVIGAAYLAQQSRATRRGTATKAGTVTDEQGNVYPAWAVRAGDLLRVSDRPDDPDRRIIETSYTHRGRSVQMTLDNTRADIDAVLERLGATVSVALG